MNEIKVTTELCEKDRELLCDLTHAIVQLTIQLKGDTEAAEHYCKCFGKPAEDAAAPDTADEPEQPKDEPTEEVEPEETPEDPKAPKVTLNDIQQKVVTLSAAGKKNEARSIVKKYADRVSEIAAGAYVEVWDELAALEG